MIYKYGEGDWLDKGAKHFIPSHKHPFSPYKRNIFILPTSFPPLVAASQVHRPLGFFGVLPKLWEMALERSYQDLVVREGCGMMIKSCLKDWESVAAADPHVEEDKETSGGGFDCNICLETVQDPVVTLCGHLYCWPCIYRWLQVQGSSTELDAPTQPQCPVCKAEVYQETLVPLYGRGGSAKSSKSKACNLGIVVPHRPFSATCRVDSPRSIGTRRSPQDQPPLSQQHPIYDDSQLDIPPTAGMIGVLATAFGRSPCLHRNSYNLVGMSSPRVRRHLMETDESLGRISFFLMCCFVLCLLLF